MVTRLGSGVLRAKELIEQTSHTTIELVIVENEFIATIKFISHREDAKDAKSFKSILCVLSDFAVQNDNGSPALCSTPYQPPHPSSGILGRTAICQRAAAAALAGAFAQGLYPSHPFKMIQHGCHQLGRRIQAGGEDLHIQRPPGFDFVQQLAQHLLSHHQRRQPIDDAACGN